MTDSLAELMEQIQAPVNFSRGKLCLNMIVKNESRIIERLLESVAGIIDAYCICDTGSQDETVRIIQEYMKKKGIPGVVFTEPFKNFGHNRTVALERATEWGEYALLLDADMKLVIGPDFSKQALCENGYSIMQRNGSLEYMNLRIVKTGIGVKCVGPTHEYYDFPNGGYGHKLTSMWIEDIGDGGAKSDKFERDVRLLEAGLKEDPKNGRYMYYLGNSYKNLGKYVEAIEWYKRRVLAGGWIEETFYSCYEIGCCYRELKDMANAVFWWLDAYDRHPKRAESLYEVVKYYREAGNQKIAQLICDKAMKIPYPKDDVLFIRKDVYEYLFDYENSILSYYSGTPVDHYRYLQLLSKNYNRDNVLSNYKFYVKKLTGLGGKIIDFCGKAEKMIGGRIDTFVSSSPCILPCSEGYLMNVRYVNYTIQPNGSYTFQHSDGKITTLQLVCWLNRDFSILDSQWIDQVQDPSLRYQGIEDVKVFSHKGNLLFLGTVEHPTNGNICVGKGSYDLSKDCLIPTPLLSPTNDRCEKNWCYFHTFAGDLRVVYKWSPIQIGTLEQDKLTILHVDPKVPPFFKDLRGSSNGCLVGEEIWFLCHYVEYSTPRHYYHILVVLDAKTLVFVRHSILFKFNGDSIEYALGLIVEPERLVFSYSRMDRTSAVMTLDRAIVEKELFAASV